MKNQNLIIRIANELRKTIWRDQGFPVDPVTIANNLGIKVMETDLPESISSALIKKKGQDPVIVLHNKDSDGRKRFLCAHELGHFIFQLQEKYYPTKNIEKIDEYDYIDLKNQLLLDNTSDELIANRFATSLLMPEREIKRLQAEEKNHLLMAFHFDVPVEIMIFCLNRGLEYYGKR